MVAVVMYHRINSRADEERLLLQQKLALQSTIRKKRENQRRKRTHDTDVYTKIFEPVTKTIQKLNPTSSTGLHPATDGQSMVKKQDDDDDVDNYYGANNDEESKYDPSAPTTTTTETAMDIPLLKEESNEFYQDALAYVPRKYRDDGQLGLCPRTKQIGNYTYQVLGDTLQVFLTDDRGAAIDSSIQQFDILNLDVWKLLLVLNPARIGLTLMDKRTQEYFPFVWDYFHIVRKLNLLETYTARKDRTKYVLLTSLLAIASSSSSSSSGSGIKKLGRGKKFLFSSIPPRPSPPSIATPPVVVLPTSDETLMSELYRALAELRAGNTSMRNLVVPMAREARQRHILPPNLLTPYEESWVLV